MELLKLAIDIILHMDVYLNQIVTFMGPWAYLVFFLIIFCETGIVVTPFLPGDSFLFALGALCTLEGSTMNLPLLCVLLIVAAILGDAVNYSIGRKIGPKVFQFEDSIWLSKKHLKKAEQFYEKHGGKTIILARFVPIIRTFAPFVAGIGRMNYGKFATYNITGGISWVLIFLVSGYFFGNIPAVKTNFHYVIFGIIIVSFLPVAIEFIKAKRETTVKAF